MWKNLNKILHDKNDYHLDPLLKQDVEISDDLLQTTIKYQKNLIPRKIRYFFLYDKLFFLRLASKYLLKLFILLLIVGTIVVVSLLAFGIDINVKKIPKTDYTQYPVYVPSTGNIEKDSIIISNYRKTFNKEAKYITFYMKDPSKDYKEWKEKLHGIESNGWENPYEARREGSQYWGKYQMGDFAREAIGLSKITWEKWKTNPELQEAAVRLWVDIIYHDLGNYVKKYDGKFLNGWSITESGIIAMAHNVGPAPVMKWLDNGGMGVVPKDGSGRDATRFLILGNYDLEIDK